MRENQPECYSFHSIVMALRHVLWSNGAPEWIWSIYTMACSQANREHLDSSRQYCHVGHRKNTICYAKATDDLALEWKLGLAIHEFGHLILQHEGIEDHSEDEANKTGGQACGIRVVWRGEEHLEWARCPRWLEDLL